MGVRSHFVINHESIFGHVWPFFGHFWPFLLIGPKRKSATFLAFLKNSETTKEPKNSVFVVSAKFKKATFWGVLRFCLDFYLDHRKGAHSPKTAVLKYLYFLGRTASIWGAIHVSSVLVIRVWPGTLRVQLICTNSSDQTWCFQAVNCNVLGVILPLLGAACGSKLWTSQSLDGSQ